MSKKVRKGKEYIKQIIKGIILIKHNRDYITFPINILIIAFVIENQLCLSKR